MAEFIAVANRDEMQDGQMKMAKVENREILLAKVSGKYYAVEGRCPHMNANLWHGKLEGTIVTCPAHNSQFDITDGHVVRWTNWSGAKLALAKTLKSPRPLQTYEVKIEDNKIMVASSGKVTAGSTK